MTDKDIHARTVALSKPCSREEMLSRVARLKDLMPDRNAFPDLEDPARARDVNYIISTDNLAGPAAIDAPHNLHMAISRLGKHSSVVVHAHPYSEIFMPLDARFRFYWGDDLEESVELDPFDTISVPAGVHRSFECLDKEEGLILTIFDNGGGDPHTGITVPQEMYDKYYKDSGWRPTTPADGAPSAAD